MMEIKDAMISSTMLGRFKPLYRRGDQAATTRRKAHQKGEGRIEFAEKPAGESERGQIDVARIGGN